MKLRLDCLGKAKGRAAKKTGCFEMRERHVHICYPEKKQRPGRAHPIRATVSRSLKPSRENTSAGMRQYSMRSQYSGAVSTAQSACGMASLDLLTFHTRGPLHLHNTNEAMQQLLARHLSSASLHHHAPSLCMKSEPKATAPLVRTAHVAGVLGRVRQAAVRWGCGAVCRI